MSKLAVGALFAVQTAAQFLEFGLGVARIAGLPVDTWRAGDPTRSLYKYLAEALASLDATNAEYIKAGFLSSAAGEWLTVLAWEVYGVERVEATPATPTVTITNNGGGFYPIEPGDLIVRNTVTDQTYRNTNAGTLSAGATVTFELEADEAGSDGSVAENEIDEIVAPALLGCEIVSSTAAVGTDEQSNESLREQCRATTGALSPNGPADAYEYVARNPELTGVSDVTRARTVDDSDTGEVTLYIASPSGAVAGASVTAVQDAIERWATPLCITPTVVSANAVTVNVTSTLEGPDLPADAAALVEARIGALFAAAAISDGSGFVSRSELIAAHHAALPTLRRVVLTAPAADVVLAAGEVPAPGAFSVSEA